MAGRVVLAGVAVRGEPEYIQNNIAKDNEKLDGKMVQSKICGRGIDAQPDQKLLESYGVIFGDFYVYHE